MLDPSTYTVLTKHALEWAGLRHKEADESFNASFHSLHSYELQGIRLDNDENEISSEGTLHGVPYQVAVGTSINSLTRLMLNDDLVEDEEKWREAKGCHPPFTFILIHIGPTKEHAMTGEFLKIDGSRIITYQSFKPAYSELREMEKKIVPNLVSALSCSFIVSEHRKIRKLACDTFGITSSGEVVNDFGFDVRTSVVISDKLESTKIKEGLQHANDLAKTINPDVSYFLNIALEENDSLRRFLYFFLVIERQTNSAFSSLDHKKSLSEVIKSPDRVQKSSIDFFQTQWQDHWKKYLPLQGRFIWCAINIWHHLTDDDIETFKELKEIRDGIAHGKITIPPDEKVTKVEQLAIKLLSSPANYSP